MSTLRSRRAWTPPPARPEPLPRVGQRPDRRPRLLLAGALALAVLGAASGQDGELVGPQLPGWLTPPRSPDDPIVARVGEVALPLSLVAAKLALEPAGTTPAAVLDRLIDEEVLAQHAARLGLSKQPEVQDAWKRAAVQQLLERDFEPTARATDLPEELLKQAYAKNRGFFNPPELISVVHLLLPVSPKADPATWQTRGKEAEQLHAQLLRDPPRSKDEFVAWTEARHAEGRDVRAEDLGPVARKSPYVAEFLDATFRLQHDGELSPPVRTQYGWHVLYRYGFNPARSTSYEQARPELVQRVWADWRAQRFQQWSDELKGRARVTLEAPAGAWPIRAAASAER